MTGQKGQSLYELANSSFVHSLEQKEKAVSAPIPSSVSSSIVDKIVSNFHKRLSDDPDNFYSDDDDKTVSESPSLKARESLKKLDGLMLEEFSTEDYPHLDQEIVFDILAKPQNRLKSVDLTNMKIAEQISYNALTVLDMVDLEEEMDYPTNDSGHETMETEHMSLSPRERETYPEHERCLEMRQRKKSERRGPRIKLARTCKTIKFPDINKSPPSRISIRRSPANEQHAARHAVNTFLIDCTDVSPNLTPEDNGTITGINYSTVRTIVLSKETFPALRELSVGSVTCLSLFHPNPPALTYLDLSHIVQPNYQADIFNHLDLIRFPIGCLRNTLKSLILHETEFDENFLEAQVFKCHLLEVLDVSQVPREHRYAEEEIADNRLKGYKISTFLDRLPNLVSLDLSGTSAGRRLKEEKMIILSGENGCKRIELPCPSKVNNMSPALPAWLNRLPLSFLGLWGCGIDYENMHLLAHSISGSKSAKQLLITARKWKNEPAMAATIWNCIFDFLKNSNDPAFFLEDCIRTFEKYYNDHEYKLPLILSANMYYVVSPLLDPNPCKHVKALKERAIKCLIRCINFNLHHMRVIRNCLLTLLKFRIPADLLFIYETSASTLLKILTKYQTDRESELLVQMAVQIANQIVCQVNQERKLATKKIKFIDTICQVITQRLEFDSVDDSLKGCWSCLWNVTDEAPANSERFIRHNGVDLFLKCLNKFPEDTELKRNIMGLVGNIAEVPELRKDLIRTETIRFYTEALTESGESSLEVAYNACGTLSHLMSDTSTPWPDSLLARKPEIAEMMCEAIKSWDESAERNINYRSLKPIIHLLKCFHCPEAQTWATWALASLTHGDPDKKYCKLTHEEGGFECLQDIVNYERTNEFVRGVAQKVIDRVSYYIAWHST